MQQCGKPKSTRRSAASKWVVYMFVHSLLPPAVAVCGPSNWAHNGLKVGLNYHTPVAMISEDWIDNNYQRVLEQPPDHPDWWTVLKDPVLNDIVQT